jgi:predicted ester cyclase
MISNWLCRSGALAPLESKLCLVQVRKIREKEKDKMPNERHQIATLIEEPKKVIRFVTISRDC